MSHKHVENLLSASCVRKGAYAQHLLLLSCHPMGFTDVKAAGFKSYNELGSCTHNDIKSHACMCVDQSRGQDCEILVIRCGVFGDRNF